MRGIDVSAWQGEIDWSKAHVGLDFVLLRAHEKYGEDKYFQRNYSEVVKNGLRVGVYKLSYASTVESAKEEVAGLLGALKGKALDLPVFLDLEDAGGQQYITYEALEKIISVYQKGIEGAGYRFGIYCNKDWYENYIPDSAKGYNFWIASYPYNDVGTILERVKPTYPKVICWQYSKKGSVEGISGHVDMDTWVDNALTDVPPSEVGAEDVLNVLRGWLGATAHQAIIDIYNAHKPLAMGYALSMSDAWCDATVSAAFIVLGADGLIGGTECGVQRHVELFKRAGIWTEDGTITPKKGDIIVFNWDENTQPNDGFADHIGVIEEVKDGKIHTIEGNCNSEVSRRTYQVGDGNIRGFARPKYGAGPMEKTETPPYLKSLDQVATEVIQGKWGNGKIRERLLTEAGYSYRAIQAEVNRRMK